MYGHPGKKLMFMGQEFAQVSEWNENVELPWNVLEYPVHKKTQDYVKALNQLYRMHPALYQKDFHPDGFEWINCSRSEDNIVSFLRKTGKPEETLLFVCNFAPVEHEKFQVGVPFYGKYKEILNSDAEIFGGSGKGNPRAKTSKQEEWDDRENSLVIDLPPMCTLVFSCTPVKPPKKAVKKAEAAGKDAAGEKKAEAAKRKAAAEKKEKAAVAKKSGEGSSTRKKGQESAEGTKAKKTAEKKATGKSAATKKTGKAEVK